MTEVAPEGPTRDREDMSYHRRNWAVQRTGWLLMALLLLLGLLGGLGGGPLARTTRGAGGFSMRYDRVVRLSAPTTWVLRIPAATAGRVELTLEDSLLARIEIDGWSPPPDRVTATSQGQRLEFLTPDNGSATIRFQFTPKRLGRIRTDVGGGANTIALSMLVLP